MDTKLLLVKRHSTENEQYSKKTNTIIFGLKEAEGENCSTVVTEIIEKKLTKKVNAGDIVCVLRIPGKTMPAPIIVQFSNRELKLDNMKRRRLLKGTGIVIADDLCNDLVQTLNRLKSLPTVAKAWSCDGKLFAQLADRDGSVIKVKYGEPLDDAIQR